MNYDQMAKLKSKELREKVVDVLEEYNYLTQSRLTNREVRVAPKARLLYIYCRYWAEIDAALQVDKMKEEIERREEYVKQQQHAAPPQVKPLTRTFTVTVKEVL